MNELANYLEEAFSTAELRRFLTERGLGNSVPSEGVPPSEFVFESAHLLRRHGLLDAELFERLLELRPRHEKRIRALAESLGVRLSDFPSVSPPVVDLTRPVQPIDRIFRATGSPEITYVAPSQLGEIEKRLRTLGEGLVVEGASGVGKTTVVRHALVGSLGADLKSLEATGRVTWLSSKDEGDLKALQSIVSQGRRALRGHLVIDDFHRLNPDLQRDVANLMKLVADASEDVAKIVVIGINPVGRSLVRDFPDLAGRFDVVSMNRQPKEKIEELISKGEAAANIRFEQRSRFVDAAGGSFYTAQLLCLEAVRYEGVLETATELVSIRTGPEGIANRVQNRLKFKYHEALVRFASYDESPPPRGATLCLLWMLARRSDDAASLDAARFQFPAVSEALDWLLQSNLATLMGRDARLQELLFYNRDAGVLSAEDPQLNYYLNHISWPALARESGHQNLEFELNGSPVFRSPSSEAAPPAAPAAGSGVVLPRSWVLHLSDLHFGTPQQAIQWYDQLREDLVQEFDIDRLSAVLLSGDITNRAHRGEFDAAGHLVSELRKGYGLSSQQIVLVPGNHDLDWGAARRAYTPRRREDCSDPLVPGAYIDGGAYVELRDDALWNKRFQAFADFYYSVRGEPYPLEPGAQATLHHFASERLVILGLNSAWAIDHHFKDRADIHAVALGRALERIDLEPLYEGCLKLALWHHPIQSAGDDRIRDTGFVERLAKAGFRFALHGHVHRADVSQFRYDLSDGGRRIDFLGAGTFGAPSAEWTAGVPLQYQLLEFQGQQLKVHTRRREEVNGAWKPDARWLQGPGQDPRASYVLDL